MLASSWLDLAGGAYMKARYRARQVPRGYFAGFCRASRPQTLLTETSGTRGSVALLLAPFVRGSFPDITASVRTNQKKPRAGPDAGGPLCEPMQGARRASPQSPNARQAAVSS